MKPTYKALARKLDTAIRSLPKADAPVFRSQVSEWIEDRPFSEIRVADAACREFAAGHEWPQMDNAVLAQIQLRLEAAVDLCDGMQKSDPSTIPDDEEDALAMLLIEYWHGRGPEWARRKYDNNA